MQGETSSHTSANKDHCTQEPSIMHHTATPAATRRTDREPTEKGTNALRSLAAVSAAAASVLPGYLFKHHPSSLSIIYKSDRALSYMYVSAQGYPCGHLLGTLKTDRGSWSIKSTRMTYLICL